MAATPTLICPKCRGEMRSYERNGVLVDKCGACRGIFLDPGELERLLDAESGPPTNGHDRDDPSERQPRDKHKGHPEQQGERLARGPARRRVGHIELRSRAIT